MHFLDTIYCHFDFHSKSKFVIKESMYIPPYSSLLVVVAIDPSYIFWFFMVTEVVKTCQESHQLFMNIVKIMHKAYAMHMQKVTDACTLGVLKFS